ncbi:MAG: O-antigen ligase family protein [Verrucomicrobia subdivision 3 bacterium]|nr:O-antigen ligase family protein [Limisphaerales bacterium]
MSETHLAPRSLLVFGVALPLAAIIGYMVATPHALTSQMLIGLVLCVLSIPIFLRWHHPLLIFTWNGCMTAFFLPGRPNVWMVIAGMSFGITVLSCILNKDLKLQNVPSMTWPLLFLAFIVLVTAKLNGGGLRTLGGSSYGGKGYIFILAAIIGYFALSTLRIPAERAQLFAILFFLSAITFVVSNLAYVLGPTFWFLFYAFPVEFALSQAAADFTPGESMTRIGGLGFGCMAVCNVLLLRYGVRGLLDVSRPWRIVLYFLAMAAGFFGGFRSTLVIIGLIFIIQFLLEGLHRTRYLLAVLLATVLGLGLLIPTSSKLPLSVQRVLTVFPFLEVDPVAKVNAQASVEWRVQMWRVLLPEVRNYFFIGKGYRIDPTDLYLVQESVRRGLAQNYEGAIVAGDYHSGPLSTIIPFGIFGLLAFLWILAAGAKVLYRNWKFGAPEVKNINSFLFAIYITKVIFYFVVFGAFYQDLAFFLGIVGFSIALNGGMHQPAKEARPALAPELLPAHA